ncbi:S1-like domain-containing RNA-binding protein [Puniceicoccus vermicola]|uniref:GntR family transcriptional regulator n=1 Tax=Puniceicoccus vermicola TaxID=388746 RepID=A0A7X1E4I9_9BACT|nr:GntR family transcriptional regulator [Puniceicoccus vermicola]
MAQIGKINVLPIIESSDHGFYLDGGEHDKILLPNAYVDTTMEIGKEVEVFIYGDSEDRLVATTETPLVQAGEFACLEVVHVHPRMGAFLDWGLQKDLLLPYREQGERDLRAGDLVVVAVYVDEYSNRIVASTRLHRHFSKEVPDYQPNQPVDVIIYSRSPLGYKAIVDKTYSGLLFHGETSDKLHHGDQFQGYIKKVHEDGKIDVLRDPFGYKRVDPLSEKILEKLKAAEGRLPFNDKSSPEDIRTEFGCSKQAFKQAIGNLYKQRRIAINKAGIELV